jgi:hypothetical protein
LLASAFALAFALAPSADKTFAAVDDAALTNVTAPDEEVTVTGCVIKGEDEGYVLTNVVPASIDVANRTTDSGQATGTTSATTAGASRVIYWLENLEDDDDVPDYAGRRVEIRGELEGEVEKGAMEIERDGDWVKIKIEKDGEDDVETRLPLSVFLSADGPIGTSGTLDDDEDVELNVNVRRLDVKDARVVTGTCEK